MNEFTVLWEWHISKRIAQFILVVAIARDCIKRRLQRCQQFTQLCVFVCLSKLNGIARKNHCIGLLLVDIRDTASQTLDPQFGCRMVRSRREYVRIADLSD